jgi:predicted protein tyrosine phosphatase
MIVTAATFSLSEARECLARWPERHPFAQHRRAWVGFDLFGHERSPLRSVHDGPALVVSMADWDRDSTWRGHHGQNDDEPTIAHAREIVRHVLALHAEANEYALAVHCHAGLYRSGAVVEWVRADLGVPEDECSNRVVVCGRDDPTHNATLLRLLREAHAEATKLVER